MSKPLTKFINSIGKHLETKDIAKLEIITNNTKSEGLVYFDKKEGIVLDSDDLSLKHENLYNFIKNASYDEILISFNTIYSTYSVLRKDNNYILNSNNNSITITGECL